MKGTVRSKYYDFAYNSELIGLSYYHQYFIPLVGVDALIDPLYSELLSKFGDYNADFIYHLKYIFKVKSDNQWLSTEISLKTSKLLKQIGLHIT